MNTQRIRAAGLATIALLTTLFVLHAALFAYATLVTDSGRDLANAWAVGHGGPWPHYGPELFGRWQLGPVWFWLLALPLRVAGSITATAVFVGILAAAKIPLAYLLGQRMLDTRLGLIAALAISLPGWDSVGTLVIAHTSVVESAMLATFWLALAGWQERRAGMATAACLMLALAMHAHPTTLIATPAVVLAMWRAVLVPRRWCWLMAGMAVFVLPFLPALLAEMRSGWPQAGASLAYLGEADIGARLARLPSVLWALLTGGAWFASRFLLPSPAAALWWLAHATLLGLAALGALRIVLGATGQEGALSPRRWLWIVTLWSAAGIVFIALLRDAVPTWMVYCLAPFGAFALALGWHGLLHERRGVNAVLAVACVSALGIGLALLHQRVALEDSGQIRLPGGSIGHIATPHAIPSADSPWLSVRQFDALARYACTAPGRLALHGDLAATFDFAQGVATRLHCPPGQLPRLGGIEADRHLAGIPIALAGDLQMAPEPRRFGHILRVPVQVLAPERGRDTDVDVRYRPNRQAELEISGDRELSGRLTCAAGEVLAITNLLPFINRFSRQVQRGTTPLAPLIEGRATAYYRCDGTQLHWHIRTPDPASADVFVIRLDTSEVP